MNHLKTYPAHLALYLIGAIDFISQLPALGSLAPFAPYITGAGVLGAALHHSYQTGAASAVVKAVTSAPAKLMLTALMLGVTVLFGSQLTACATLPTASQDAAVTAAVTIATGVAIQQKDTVESGKWLTRAQQIKLIALELKQVNDAGNATLATLAADLQPRVAKLGPADVIAVNTLVGALTPLLSDQIAKNPKIGNTQVAVDTILTAVLTTCAAYGA